MGVVAWGRIGVQSGGKAETAPRHMGGESWWGIPIKFPPTRLLQETRWQTVTREQERGCVGRWREGVLLIKLSVAVATQLFTPSPSSRKITWSHLLRKLWSLGSVQV